MAISSRTKLLAHIRRRPLVPLLLAATVCVDVVLFLATDGRGRYTWIFWSGLLIGQLNLLAMWTTAQFRGWIIRAGLLICAVLAFGWFQNRFASISTDFQAGWTTVAAAYGLATLLLTMLVRFLVHRKSFSWHKWRYSMRSMVGLMTLVSIGSILAKQSDFQLMQGSLTLISIGCDGLLAALCLAVALVSRSKKIVTGICILLGAIFVVVFNWLGDIDPEARWNMVVFNSATVSQYILWLLAVRVRCAPRWKHKPTLTTDA